MKDSREIAIISAGQYPDWGGQSGDLGVVVGDEFELLETISQTALASLGRGVLSAGSFVERNKGYVKTVCLLGGWVGLTAMGMKTSPDNGPSQNIIETIIENPLAVILTSATIGAVYGTVYSASQAITSYWEQENRLKGEFGSTLREVQEATVRKTLRDITEQATNQKTGQVVPEVLAKLKLQNPILFEEDPIESAREITPAEIGNIILRTAISEFFEWLDVGVKLALVPAYFQSQTQATLATLRDAEQRGAPLEQLTEILVSSNSQAIAVLVLGSAALIADIRSALEQRTNLFPSRRRKAR